MRPRESLEEAKGGGNEGSKVTETAVAFSDPVAELILQEELQEAIRQIVSLQIEVPQEQEYLQEILECSLFKNAKPGETTNRPEEDGNVLLDPKENAPMTESIPVQEEEYREELMANLYSPVMPGLMAKEAVDLWEEEKDEMATKGLHSCQRSYKI